MTAPVYSTFIDNGVTKSILQNADGSWSEVVVLGTDSPGSGGGGGGGLGDTVWVDNTVSPPVYYVRVETVVNGATVVSWETPGGAVATPTVANLMIFSGALQPVAVSNFPATQTVIGTVGVTALPQTTTRVPATPTVTAATYAASEVIGGIMTFANILPATTYAGDLVSISLRFKGSVQAGGFYVAVFKSSPAGTFTDTNTAAIAPADTAILVGIYHLSTPISALGTHTSYGLTGIVDAIVGTSQSLYAVVVPDATTAALVALDMTVELGVMQG